MICRGVVHHTPDWKGATREVAARVAPGGVLLLGFYETWARTFHRLRRRLSRVTGGPLAALDPILRRRDLDGEKKRIWIDDQYHHPKEEILPLPAVIEVLGEAGLRSERAVPPMPPRDGLFEPDLSTLGTRTRTSWALAGPRDPDAGLVCVVARRPPALAQNTV